LDTSSPRARPRRTPSRPCCPAGRPATASERSLEPPPDPNPALRVFRTAAEARRASSARFHGRQCRAHVSFVWRRKCTTKHRRRRRTMLNQRQRTWQRVILLIVLGYEGLGGLAGGGLLVAKPDGSLMEMPVALMHGTFSDFLIPG